MKKLFVLVFAIALCLGALCVGASADYSGEPVEPEQGDGTVNDPYKISSAENLYWFAGLVNGTLTGVAQDTDANAVLTDDITINTNVLNKVQSDNTTGLQSWTPIGEYGKNGEKAYTGTFDGQGHTISGLYYDGNGNYVGLFGYVYDGGRVQNVNVADSYISNSYSGTSYTGGVCGRNRSGDLTNCSFDGSVTGSGLTANVGGVCGWSNSGMITNCYNTGSVTVTTTGNGTFANVGGVCGCNGNYSTIYNCYNTGTVTGTGTGTYTYVGGVCGYNNGSNTIKNCYNTGTVTGTGNVGGVCGYNGNHSTIDNCYWLNSGLVGIGGSHEGSTANNVESKTNDQFASGEVAWLLNQGQEYGPWRQNLSGDKDNDPVLNSTHQKVVKLTVDSAVSYLNSGDEVEEPAEGKVYVDGDGNIVQTPYTVGADTTLTSKYLVTAAIDTTSTLSKVYDGKKDAPDGLSIALEGVVSGDDVTATATCSFDNANVGNGKAITASNITLTGDDAGEYVLRNTTAETYAGEITPKTVTITADDKSAFMGDEPPELSYKADGLIGSDKLTEKPILICDADMTKAGTYEITVSGGAASENYELAYKNGTLTVWQSWVVTVKPGNGAADEISYIHPGESFTIPDTPKNSGYIFLGWRCGDETYRVGETIEVTSDMTFTAVWGNLPDVDPEEPEPEPELPFYDVAKGDWFYDSVYYVWENGLMDGTSATTFEPNATLTRAMVWTIIARTEGVDTDGGATWYAKAQEWVTAMGISDGENPSAAITRQELVTMLWRLSGEPVVNYALTAPDADVISSWALEAMRWAVSEGIVEGDETGLIHPTATCTRAEAAAILMRLG